MMETPKNVSGYLGATGGDVSGEKLQPHLYTKVRGLEQSIAFLENKIEQLEKLNEQCFKANPISQIEERFKKIEAEFPKIKEAFSFVHFKKLHKCPACDGEGYKRWAKENMAGGSRCSTCEGIGIVWG